MKTNEKRETLERQRAAFAYERVSGWEKSVWGSRALALVKGLPVAMRTQGLSVTLATLMGKEGIEYRELASLLADWVMESAPVKPLGDLEANSNDAVRRFLKAAVSADRRTYLAAQSEALAMLEMVKVMAQAIFKAPVQPVSTLEEKTDAP